MSRVLFIELRRSAAIGTAVILAVTGTLLIYFLEAVYFADGWMQLAMTMRLYLGLLLPLALAAGAWQARREQRSAVAELFATTPRPRAQRIMPVILAMTIAVVAGYLTMGLAGALWIAGTARYLPGTVFAVVGVGLLAQVTAVWLGSAVGRLLPSPVTAPLLGVAGLAALLLIPGATSPNGWMALLLSPIFDMNMPQPYETVPGVASAAQALWLAGLAGTAMLLLISADWRLRVAALLPVALGFAVGVMVMPHTDRVVTAVDTRAQELVCTADEPRVCLSRVHAGLLPEVTGPAREALTLLATVPGAPNRVHEDTSTYSPDVFPPREADVVLLDITVGQDAHLEDREDLAANVLIKAFRNPWSCENTSAGEDAMAAAFWLLDREPALHGEDDQGFAEDATARWRALVKLPADEAAARVAALRTAATNCAAADGILLGGARP
ncbi:hypothetical protein [Actinoplanes derwentensis]|uniref:ABC-type transport system involved in multi-copper enzyme maturation, permease component n=1 Tax=Actinoplanes derwentensis TaxID=113562 RepID=A0A1H1UEG1_9ACTN|nr:hypothetical protein [Actinoplanes derwentensis]GID85277.1 hypothetical protein Ade03nite_42010 [Actinoplanes derwentensis]SDS70586.1 hypothetical protein SAMN04489716_1409 [Actinoplanes derwentensis]